VIFYPSPHETNQIVREQATAPLTAKLLFVHGFSDFCDQYGILFPTLASRGIEIYSFDQRGWGRTVTTKASRGATGPTSLVTSDINDVLLHVLEQAPTNVPTFLGGHSMGGGEILTFAADGPASTRAQIAGYLAEAPLIDLADGARPLAITVFLGRLAGKLLPKRQMVQPLDHTALSHDLDWCVKARDNPLNHDTGTLEGLAGMLDRMANLNTGKVQPKDGPTEAEKVHVWVAHGSDDRICDSKASEKFVERLQVKDKEFKRYDGWYHQLHAEAGEDKELFAKDFGDWILARVPTSTTASAPATASTPKL
jgi:acylglycerol lipase